jgi:hypothetical protein
MKFKFLTFKFLACIQNTCKTWRTAHLLRSLKIYYFKNKLLIHQRGVIRIYFGTSNAYIMIQNMLTLCSIMCWHYETLYAYILRHHMLTLRDNICLHYEASYTHIMKHHMLTLWDIFSHYETSYAQIEVAYVHIIRILTLWNIICSFYETSYSQIMKCHMPLLCLTNMTKIS